jgi:hypothetical protein
MQTKEKKTKMKTINQWMWWRTGECVVEVLKSGHFPTSVLCKLPNDVTTEIDIDELGDK